MTPRLDTFINCESQVRSYCRSFPAIFSKAKDSYLFDDEGSAYIDFFCGAGSLNFGHNNDHIKNAVVSYIQNDGILMGLDFHTQAKERFITAFHDNILVPRGLKYKLQFTSPTGTSVVESAVKLARKFTGRQNVMAFTNGYHGMTGVALSLTGSKYHRQANAYGQVTRIPYENYFGANFDNVGYIRKLIEDPSSGVDLPAAIILETVQGEGGVNIASATWLQDIRALCTEFNIVMIVDDVQAGCGRTGKFFSFERAHIQPDIVCLSKSIGGIGFPMALMLLDESLDIWSPGEDNGTFRGNNLAFVASAEMLNRYWSDNVLETRVSEKAEVIASFSRRIFEHYKPFVLGVRGLGLIQGIEFYSGDDTSAIVKLCFENNLIIETCGPRDQVLKIMPALTIELDVLQKGLSIIEAAFATYFCSQKNNTTFITNDADEILA